MKRVSIEALQQYLARIETRSDESTGRLVKRIRDEYKNRLATACYSSSGEDFFGSTLESLLDRLVGIIEELELRHFSGEFDVDEIKRDLENRSLSKPIVEMMKLLSSLSAYQETIESLTGNRDEVSARQRERGSGKDDSTVKETLPPLDIDRVLTEFDAIDVFAEYKEGDAVYDRSYEEEDRQILNRLFFDILDGYLEPLVVGFKSIVGGNNSQKLFTALLASIRPLRRSAETMGFHDLRNAFMSLEAILKQAQDSGNMIPADRIQFVKAYDQLAHSLPNAGEDVGLIDLFDTDQASKSMVLKLIGSPHIEGWMIQALLEIGITDRKKLLSTTAEEMKSVTGLPYEHCRELLIVCRREIQH